MQLFSADATVFSIFFLTPKEWKNWPQKLLIISPDLFIPKSSPDHSPQPRIDFPYYETSGSDICSLICGCYYVLNWKLLLSMIVRMKKCQLSLSEGKLIRYVVIVMNEWMEKPKDNVIVKLSAQFLTFLFWSIGSLGCAIQISITF